MSYLLIFPTRFLVVSKNFYINRREDSRATGILLKKTVNSVIMHASLTIRKDYVEVLYIKYMKLYSLLNILFVNKNTAVFKHCCTTDNVSD